ncbi:MAG TPA: thiamine-phosphate kinase [Steroidobacteraceae bacterium]|jgi:thiamine-monophosphate kinase|nr:thiamine-phosphate kinase [Steroidobacteraceae bacterium]
MGTDGDLGEFELIGRFFTKRGPGRGVTLGIGDDAAVLELPANSDLVAAVDTIVCGRHFLEGADARAVGHRALAVNLSDLAAMGATPAWATLALTMPSADADWLQGFAGGLLDLADAHRVALVGGDTTRGPLTVSVQILGYVPHGTALRRSGGRAGHILAVSGTLGDAGAGLALLKSPPAQVTSDVNALIRRFDYPTPRVQLGLAARGIASAAMDLSDGLVGDLPRLALASGLAAHVDVERLPLSAAMRNMVDAERARDWALGAGDDYELLLAVAPNRFAELSAAADQLNLTLTAIGELRAGSAVTWSLNGHNFVPRVSGYDHFAQASTQITV